MSPLGQLLDASQGAPHYIACKLREHYSCYHLHTAYTDHKVHKVQEGLTNFIKTANAISVWLPGVYWSPPGNF